MQRAGGHLHGQGGYSQTANQTCRLQMGSCLGRSLPPFNTKAFLPTGLQVRDSGSASIYFINYSFKIIYYIHLFTICICLVSLLRVALGWSPLDGPIFR